MQLAGTEKSQGHLVEVASKSYGLFTRRVPIRGSPTIRGTLGLLLPILASSAPPDSRPPIASPRHADLARERPFSQCWLVCWVNAVEYFVQIHWIRVTRETRYSYRIFRFFCFFGLSPRSPQVPDEPQIHQLGVGRSLATADHRLHALLFWVTFGLGTYSVSAQRGVVRNTLLRRFFPQAFTSQSTAQSVNLWTVDFFEK